MIGKAWIVAACLLAATPAARSQGLWVEMGYALDGTHGAPALSATGALGGDATAEIRLDGAREDAAALLLVSGSVAPVAFKGGQLAAWPAALALALRTDAQGSIVLVYGGVPMLPSGMTLVMQYVIADPEAVQGFALSNALEAHVP